MLDLSAWAHDAPTYFARLRSTAIPNGVAQYGGDPIGGGEGGSRPPLNLGAWEAAEGEAAALWRVLSHYGAEKPFNPFVRAVNRRVVGLRVCDEPEFVISCMADDVIDCVNLSGPGEVSPRTLSFCHKARSASKLIVGDLSEPAVTWLSSDVVREYEGVSYALLHAWRSRGRVRFKTVDGDFFYEADSFNAAHEKLLMRMI